MAPSEWQVARLLVIFKKGDATDTKNYRPISIVPVMSKLFSVVLYLRLRDLAEETFTDEQFGFRRGCGCDDVNSILRLVVEKSLEWGEELWIATLDVEKAFDKVHHSNLFEALVASEIDPHILATLRRL